jgi:hypothetical protein
VHELLTAIEASGLGRFMRESGPWTYSIVNLTHVLGIGALFGAVLVLDLRLLGLWPQVPVRALADAAVPVARSGFVVAVASGAALITANATEYAGNPFLLIKFPAIALGLVNAAVLGRSTAWDAARAGRAGAQDARRLAVMAAVSLLSWFTAMTAGRMIGYW